MYFIDSKPFPSTPQYFNYSSENRTPAYSPFISAMKSDPRDINRIRRGLLSPGTSLSQNQQMLDKYHPSIEFEELNESPVSSLTSTHYGVNSYNAKSSPLLLLHTENSNQYFPETNDDFGNDNYDEDIILETKIDITSQELKLPIVPQSFYYAGQSALSTNHFTSTVSPCFQIMNEVKVKQYRNVNIQVETNQTHYTSMTSIETTSRSTKQLQAKKPIDMALFLGKSFRVGWSSIGSIIYPKKIQENISIPIHNSDDDDNDGIDNDSNNEDTEVKSSSQDNKDNNYKVVGSTYLVIQRMHCTKWCETSFQNKTTYKPNSHLISKWMTDILNSSQIFATPDVSSKVPLWKLPRATITQMEEYLQFIIFIKNLLKTFQTNCCQEQPSDINSNENKDIIDLPRDHPCWIIYHIITFFDSICGQEVIFLNKLKSGQELLSDDDQNTSLMPLYEYVHSQQGDGYWFQENNGLNYNSIELKLHYATLWERRREAICQWFEKISYDPNGMF